MWPFKKDDKEQLKQQFKEVEARLNPPVGIITEEQHRKAYTKYVLGRLDNTLFSLAYHYKQKDDPTKMGNGFTHAEMLDNELKYIAKKSDEWKGQMEFYESWYPFEDFMKVWAVELVEPHCGDCTAVASPCSRCHAEEFYSIPNTATWNGKNEGWKLYNQYYDLKDKLTKLENK